MALVCKSGTAETLNKKQRVSFLGRVSEIVQTPIQYHVWKLRRDPAYVREVIEQPEGTVVRDALRRAIATPEGEETFCRAIVLEILELSSGRRLEHLREGQWFNVFLDAPGHHMAGRISGTAGDNPFANRFRRATVIGLASQRLASQLNANQARRFTLFWELLRKISTRPGLNLTCNIIKGTAKPLRFRVGFSDLVPEIMILVAKADGGSPQ